MAQFIEHFHFLYPEWLILLLPILLFLGWVSRQKSSDTTFDHIVDPALAPYVLTQGENASKRRHWLWLYAVAVVIAVIALAGPSWKKIKQNSFQNQQAAVIVMDLSSSMYATDTKPDRLSRARFELIDLLKQRQDGQTGLIVYAGAAFVVTPLTDDVETIIAQAKYINPEDMPVQGSLLAPAIDKAVDLLKQSGLRQGQIIAMTDGVDDVMSSAESIRSARSQGYSTSILSIGTKDGAPVPLRDGGFLKDAEGNVVVPKVNEAEMQQLISQYGNGIFVSAQFDDSDLQAILAQLDRAVSNDDLKQNQDKQLESWRNEGIWLVLLLVPVALLMFRRAFLSVLMLLIVLPQPEPVYAGWWEDLWQTSDQQAQIALENEQARAAAEQFENPDWKATAFYRAGEFKQAAELYAKKDDADSLYNLGNALAKSQNYAEAIKAYEAALAQQPEHEDAQYNLDLLKKMMEQQSSSEQQQSQQQSGDQGQQEQSSDQSSPSEESANEGESQQQAQDAASEQDQSADATDSQDQLSEAEKQAQENEAKEQQALEDYMEQQAEQEQQDQSQAASDTMPTNPEPLDEQERERSQATEQWLRQIPDDPSGLWRRKFHYQYRRGAAPDGAAGSNPW